MSGFKLEEHSFRLLKNEPFFSALSRCVQKIVNRGIPTAGVMVNPHTAFFEMHYNPEFFENLGKTDENGKEITDPQKILERREIECMGVLKHEFYHLIFEHVTGRLPAEGMSLLWNIATDLAINSEISKELPFTACVPGRGYTDPKTKQVFGFEDYPLGKSSEYYFEMLKKDPRAQKAQGQQGQKGQKGIPGNGNGQGQGEPGDGEPSNGGFGDTLDDHSQWGGEGSTNETNSIAREIAKERLKDAMQQAANETIRGGRGWGSMSADMQKEILRRLETHVDWRSVLRYFIKTSQKANRQSSMRHLNRRYPMIHAGRKVSRQAKVAISIDQSGSVSDAMLAAFFAELNSLSEIADFTVIPFDDSVFVEKIYEWKRGQKRPHERVRCGGTNFDAPTNYVNEKAFDGHIILTDMIAPKPGNSKCQRMWMTTEACARQPYFQTTEKIIAIPEKDMREFQ
jgi:predicted metal-dependent peptidase